MCKKQCSTIPTNRITTRYFLLFSFSCVNLPWSTSSYRAVCCSVLSHSVWDGRMRIPELRLATGTSGIAGKSQVWCSWCVLEAAGQQGLWTAAIGNRAGLRRRKLRPDFWLHCLKMWTSHSPFCLGCVSFLPLDSLSGFPHVSVCLCLQRCPSRL